MAATTTRRRSGKKSSNRRPRFKKIDDWKKAARDPLVTALVEAYRAYKQHANKSECALAHRALLVRQRFGGAMASEIVKGVLDVDCQRAKAIIASSHLWERQSDKELWAVVGRRGVARIDAVRPVRAQTKLKEVVMTMSATNAKKAGTPIVSTRYIDRKISQLKLKTAAPKQPKAERGPKTKTQVVVTIERAKAALSETHALLARTPALEGCFSVEALETIKKVK